MSIKALGEGQVIICPHCGGSFISPEQTNRSHAPRGSGANYTIDHLEEEHHIVLKSLFNLEAFNQESRKTRREVYRYARDGFNAKMAEDTVGGRLSELQNINLQFCRSWPNKVDLIDPNPTYRPKRRFNGWYITLPGIRFLREEITVLDAKIQPLIQADSLDKMFGWDRVVFDKGEYPNRLEVR